MAGNLLGALLVKLGLDAAEFTSGLTKAQYQAQQFARSASRDFDSLRSSIKSVAGFIGGLYIGDVLLQNAKSIIAEAEALNDLADSTGASVEQLSALRNQAYIAGTDIGTLQGALNKLAAGMAGTDEETSKAKDALKALGISTRDPAQAFQEIAQKLATYEDGVNKVGIAVALFGKSGASLLPILKDIADLQDVGATVTKQQADAAENLGKEYRRLTVEATAFKDMLLSGVVPALADTIKAFRIAQGQGAGFFQSLDFAMRGKEEVAENIATIEKNVAALQARLEAYKATTASTKPAFASTVAEMTAEIERAQRALKILNAIAAPKEMDFGPPVMKAQAPSGFGGKDSKAAKETISDAERYINSLRDQVEKTLDLTAAEQVLREVQVGRLEKATRAQIDQALAYAQEIDAAKARKDAADAARKAEEDAARVRERISQMTMRDIESAQKEAQAMRDANEQLREQKVFLEGGQDALDAYTIAKLNKAAAEKEDEAAMLANAGAAQAVIDATREQAAALRERAALVSTLNIGEKMKKEADAINQVATSISDAATRAADGFVAGTASAKDALRSFLDDVEKMARRAALQGLFDKIFGVKQDGISGWDALIKFGIGFATSLGGGGGVPGVGFSGGGFGEHFAAGGVSRGGWAIAGENGPELVHMDAGARIYNAADTQAMLGGPTVVNNNSFTINGPTNRPTQRQIVRSIAEVSGREARRR